MYYPYPDDMVSFAFPVDPAFTADVFRKTYDAHMDRLAKVMEKDDYRRFVDNPALNLIIYPEDSLGEETFRWFAQAQAHRALTASLPLVARIHPGSPHMYWRHLWMGDSNHPYDLVEYPLAYHEVKNATFLPLDALGTQLVVAAREAKINIKHTGKKIPYCGDVQPLWVEEYEAGLAGNFQKCRELYLQQTSLGRRLFGHQVVARGAQEIAAPVKHGTDIGETLRATLDELKLADESLRKEVKETKQLTEDFSLETISRMAGGSKDLELELAAAEWRLNHLAQQLEATKKNYFAKEQELYRIQKSYFYS